MKKSETCGGNNRAREVCDMRIQKVLIALGFTLIFTLVFTLMFALLGEKTAPEPKIVISKAYAAQSPTTILEKEKVGRDGAPMILIAAGEFQMGSTDSDGHGDESPVQTVYLDAFYMDVYEVTNEQYARFLNQYGSISDDSGRRLIRVGDEDCFIEKVGNTYRPKWGYEDHPVAYVSWYGASEYAHFYGKRLPTAAEWEKAARGGLVGKKYPWTGIVKTTTRHPPELTRLGPVRATIAYCTAAVGCVIQTVCARRTAAWAFPRAHTVATGDFVA
jgi:formylglycine-generating enzyme required for sulfatase activity